MSTITVQLPEPLARQLRESNVPEQKLHEIIVAALQQWLGAWAKRDHTDQPLPAERTDAARDHEYFRRLLKEAYGDTPPSDDDPFVDGMTRGEYLALSDEDEKSLWNKWFVEELDKTLADNVTEKVTYGNVDAIPA